MNKQASNIITSATPSCGSRRDLKCIVWDLDQTVWEGVLLEGGALRLREKVREVIDTLSNLGILHSIASRNDPEHALGRLRELGLDQCFLYPQIGWQPKSVSLRSIAAALNIGLDTLAFVDDDAFEREEVRTSLPDVACFDAEDLAAILQEPRANPQVISEESQVRAQMIRAEEQRRVCENSFVGANEDFMKTLGTVLTIAPATADDLPRIQELTARTTQLNTTGWSYTPAELETMLTDPGCMVVVASLRDRFGSYGRIGLAITRIEPECWTTTLMIISCRVASRGVGSLLIDHIVRGALAAGKRCCCQFVATSRNRMLYLAYRLAGFGDLEKANGVTTMQYEAAEARPIPSHITLIANHP